MGDLTEHFDSSEMKCPCCGKADMNLGSVRRLERVRVKSGVPMPIVVGGGYRCYVYGGSMTSAHNEGKGFDLGIAAEDYHAVMKAAFAEGFTGIGVKNKGGKFQLHLDDAEELRGVRPRPCVWSY